MVWFITNAETRSINLAHARSLYEAVEMDEALSMTERWLVLTPDQADVVHDFLAYLAEQMIELNKERQIETKGFLTWLGREIAVPMDELIGKTVLQNYMSDYQKAEDPATLEQILAVLRKNKNKFTVDVSGRTFQERLAKEYQASLDKLLPIKHKLADTDRLIDQIVYALYGLTEEEIAMVEGKSA